MKKTNLESIRWKEHKSPKGDYHIVYRDIAAQFRLKKSGPPLPGEPPFEVELVKLPPGAKNFPFHSHATEWEFYLVVSGAGTVRAGEKRAKINAGDCFLNPPGEPHQITNTGEAELVYYVVANNGPTDVCHYPDSGKWGARAIGKIFRPEEVGYWDGEE